MNWDIVTGGLISLGSSLISIYAVEFIRFRRDIQREKRALYADFSDVTTQIIALMLAKVGDQAVQCYQRIAYHLTKELTHKDESIRMLIEQDKNADQLRKCYAQFRKLVALYRLHFGHDDKFESSVSVITSFSEPALSFDASNPSELEAKYASSLKEAQTNIRDVLEVSVIELLEVVRDKVLSSERRKWPR